jgi:hypothetical protein
MDAESEDIKQVYARFGLALYCAQVLEHGVLTVQASAKNKIIREGLFILGSPFRKVAVKKKR